MSHAIHLIASVLVAYIPTYQQGDLPRLAFGSFNGAQVQKAGVYPVPRARRRRQAFPEEFGDYITERRPVAVTLQEMTRRDDDVIAQTQARHPRYAAFRPTTEDPESGVWILVDGDQVDLSGCQTGERDLPRDGMRWRRPLFYVDCPLRGSEASLRLVTAHLTPDLSAKLTAHQDRQLAEIRRLVAAREYPFDGCARPGPCALLLAGDLNVSPWHSFVVGKPTARRLERFKARDTVGRLFLGGFEDDTSRHLGPTAFSADRAKNHLARKGITFTGEPSRLLDHGIVIQGAAIVSARLALRDAVMTTPLGAAIPLSDHYLLDFEIVVFTPSSGEMKGDAYVEHKE